MEFPDVSTKQVYTRGIIGEIFEKDVKTRKRISNIAVYERVQSFLLNNYASPFSITNLMESLKEEGFSTKPSTVRGYIEDLKKANNRLNFGPSLENIVYLYLVSHDYQVSVGKIGKFECDFIVRDKNQSYAYVQVTYIISLDKFRDQQEGVHHINAIDLFLGKETI